MLRQWEWLLARVATQAAKTRARARVSETQSGLGRGLTTGRARLAEPRVRATELAVRAQ